MGPTERVLTATTEMSWARVADWLLSTGLSVGLILLGALVARWLAHRLINRTVAALVRGRRTSVPVPADADADSGPSTDQLPVVRRHARRAARALEGQFANPDRQRQRVETLGAVLRSAATIVIWTIALLMIGDTLGLNMAPVLASAGVGGLAIGFGAQSLVKDFLSGMFMLAEDQYGVGDVIDTGDAIGTVEDVTMRMTRLRDASGVVWYVRNGEIRRIGNRSQGWSTALVDLPVGAEESAQHVIDVLGAAMTAFDADPAWSEHLLEAPTVAGVESVGGGAITVRITARCPANQHIAVQRAIRERALAALAQAGIRLAPGAPPSGPVPAPASS